MSITESFNRLAKVHHSVPQGFEILVFDWGIRCAFKHGGEQLQFDHEGKGWSTNGAAHRFMRKHHVYRDLAHTSWLRGILYIGKLAAWAELEAYQSHTADSNERKLQLELELGIKVTVHLSFTGCRVGSIGEAVRINAPPMPFDIRLGSVHKGMTTGEVLSHPSFARVYEWAQHISQVTVEEVISDAVV